MNDQQKINMLPVKGAYVIIPPKSIDQRGWFSRVMNAENFLPDHSWFDVACINTSFSHLEGTLRGLHWQEGASAEAKFLCCLKGRFLDLIVDVRFGSETFGVSCQVPLSSDQASFIYVPRGCAHGILTLEDNTEMLYLVDRPFDPDSERGMRWNDTFASFSLSQAPKVISEKDRSWPDFVVT